MTQLHHRPLWRTQAVAFGQGLVALLPQLSALTQILPPPTLEWKLRLLEEGNRCRHMV